MYLMCLMFRGLSRYPKEYLKERHLHTAPPQPQESSSLQRSTAVVEFGFSCKHPKQSMEKLWKLINIFNNMIGYLSFFALSGDLWGNLLEQHTMDFRHTPLLAETPVVSCFGPTKVLDLQLEARRKKLSLSFLAWSRIWSTDQSEATYFWRISQLTLCRPD